MGDLFKNIARSGRREKNLPNARYYTQPVEGEPVWKNWSAQQAIRDGYKSSVWVYASIRTIAKAVARTPWTVIEKLDESSGIAKTKPVPDHPVLELLKNPNPIMSQHDLFERVVSHLYLAGNAIWLKLRAGRPKTLRELHPIEPDLITPVPGANMTVKHYEYESNGKSRIYQPDQIVHFQFSDPANPYWGVSPLQAASRVIDTEVEALKWNKSSLNNRAVPSGVFSFSDYLTEEQFEESTEQIRLQHSGSANARAPWIVGSGGRWQPMSMTPAEMDFINGRKFNLVEIAAAMGILPAMFAPDAATFSNLREARKALWVETVTAILDGIRSTMNRLLMSEYDDSGEYYLTYDLADNDALRAEFKNRVEAWEILVRNGYPPNLASRRLELDMPDVEGGDEPYGLDPENRGRLRNDPPRNNDNTNEPADRNDRQPEPG